MNCVICDRWQRTPYFKRHTTPTTAQDTEMALVLGFWLARRAAEGVLPKFCERHGVVFFQLDVLEDARIRQEELAAVPSPQQNEYLARALDVTRHLSAPVPPVPLIPPLVPPVGLLGASVPPPPEPEPMVSRPIEQSQPTPAQEIVPSAPDKPQFPCPLCHKIVVSGEVHTC